MEDARPRAPAAVDGGHVAPHDLADARQEVLLDVGKRGDSHAMTRPFSSREGKETPPARLGSTAQGSFSAMLLAQPVLLHPLRRGLGERRAELPQPRHLK